MKKKKRTINELRKELWRVFSKWIKVRDKYICFTCGNDCEGKANSGHFFHGKSVMSWIDERNVHCQCIGCNKYKSGNLAEYSLKLLETYGGNIIYELKQLKSIKKKWEHKELEDKIEYYKNKTQECESEQPQKNI
jgi:hypothetical protein